MIYNSNTQNIQIQKHKTNTSMRLTPGQACFLHGLWDPKTYLTWEHVLNNNKMTCETLLSANISWKEMHTLQPDIRQWICNNKMTKQHIFKACEYWTGDLIKEFQFDIGDLVNPLFTVELLKKLNMTYEKMCQMGLTGENMRLFTHITLVGWSNLGFNKKQAERIHEAYLYYSFGMRKADVLASLQ
jgi:hypothetical protein